MQVGDFFELYGIDNEHEKVGADMYTIGDICNLTVTRKNKTILENNRSNPLMAGFPLHALSKHSQLLLDNGYTVVIIRQVTPPPNVKREVTEIISPSTTIVPHGQDGSYMLVICWDANRCVGVAGADVSTGHVFTYEVASTHDDHMRTFDEAFRIVQSYQPKEMLLCGTGDQEYIERLLVPTCSSGIVHKRWDEKLPEKLAYQNEVLGKVYGINAMMTPIEYIGLDKYTVSRTALVRLIQFIYEHNEHIIQKLQQPEIIENRAQLILEYNSALQLNLISTMSGEKPLMTLLNKCCTAPGSREFRRRLLAPLVDPRAIQERYERIASLLQARSVVQIRKALSNVVDIERLVRRMNLGTLSPIEWASLHSSLQYIHAVCTYDSSTTQTVQDTIQRVIDSYTKVLRIDDCAKYTMNDIKGTLFQSGIYDDVDREMLAVSSAFNELTALSQAISALDSGGGDACLCRIESNERDGYFLQMTKKRWETAIQRGFDASRYVAKAISSGSSVLRIQSDVIEQLSERILRGQRTLAVLVLEKYKEFMRSFVFEWGEVFQKIIRYVIDVDVATNNAFVAMEYGYTKPRIVEADAAFLDAKQIRHPIIERISTQVEYVPNDISLRQSGILLYGINASGKSSLMKAVGLNVIMAQAGMYVAASEFTYQPFHHVFTRITTVDNIYRGMSTFVVEMAELRNILYRSDKYSLVLGDELCAGTESVSAVSIVSAGIDALVEKQCCFIFATHLHEISDRDGVIVCHMHIERDDATGKIIYDRTLRPGRGNALYGLEVCESLGMPAAFIQRAHKVRKELQGIPADVVATKWSKYNKDVCVDMCQVCKEHPAEETHHIRPQHSASDDGFVAPGVRVHRRSNLVPLCKSCHMREHHGDVSIIGYVNTSTGVELRHMTRQSSATPVVDIDGADGVIGQLRPKYMYDVAQAQWYTISPRRKCKLETVLKAAQKICMRPLTQEEKERVAAELTYAYR
jgi:DNA mismatch repair protein MutS